MNECIRASTARAFAGAYLVHFKLEKHLMISIRALQVFLVYARSGALPFSKRVVCTGRERITIAFNKMISIFFSSGAITY